MAEKLPGETEEEIRKSAEEYAEKAGIKLNPNPEIVAGIVKGLLHNKEKKGEIYCPCRVPSGNKEKDLEIACPCIFHRGEIEIQGHCKCNLFVE